MRNLMDEQFLGVLGRIVRITYVSSIHEQTMWSTEFYILTRI